VSYYSAMLALFEIISGSAALLQCGIELIVAGIDLLSWYQSRDNRAARRTARRAGESAPPRSLWTWLFVILLIVLVALLLMRLVFAIPGCR
jgi:hypothetical protein